MRRMWLVRIWIEFSIPHSRRSLKILASGSRKAVYDGEGGEHKRQDDYFDELT